MSVLRCDLKFNLWECSYGLIFILNHPHHVIMDMGRHFVPGKSEPAPANCTAQIIGDIIGNNESVLRKICKERRKAGAD